MCCYLKRFIFYLKLYFFILIHIFSWEMSPVSCLKRPQTCFSSHFCFLVISILLILVSSVLFLVDVSSIPPRFSMSSSSRCTSASTLSSMLVSPLPPSFIENYCRSTPSLRCKALCIFISFLVFLSICLKFSLVHYNNGPEYLSGKTDQVFIPFIRFLRYSFVLTCFLVFLRYSFKIFLSSRRVGWCQLPIFPCIRRFILFWAFWFFHDLVVRSLLPCVISRF